MTPPQSSPSHEHQAWACYFLLGCGFLAPWNAFITAVDYFAAVFPGRHIDRLFTVAYLPPCLLSLVLFTVYSPPSSLHARILAGYIGFTVILLVVPLCDVLLVAGAATGPPLALGLVLASLVVLAILDGCCQPAVFGDAATLPPQYTHAVVGGTASAGVVISFLRIATKAALPATPAGLRVSTAIYFTLSAAICGGCVVIYGWLLPRLEVVAYWRAKRAGSTAGGGGNLELTPSPSWEAPGHRSSSEGGAREEGAGLLQPLTPRRARLEGLGEEQQHLTNRLHNQHGYSDGPSSTPFSTTSAALAAAAATAAGGGSSSPTHLLRPHKLPAGLGSRRDSSGSYASSTGSGSFRHTWRGIIANTWRLGAAVFLTCLVTLAIFPGFLAEDVSSAALGDWYPVLLITLFNIADLLGKNLPFGRCQLSQQQLLGLSVLRLAFLPLFVGATLAEAPAPVIALLTFALGLSNGFLTALVMTMAPMGLPPATAELAGSIMAFFLIGGLTAGAFMGWLWLLGGKGGG